MAAEKPEFGEYRNGVVVFVEEKNPYELGTAIMFVITAICAFLVALLNSKHVRWFFLYNFTNASSIAKDFANATKDLASAASTAINDAGKAAQGVANLVQAGAAIRGVFGSSTTAALFQLLNTLRGQAPTGLTSPMHPALP